MNLASDLQSFVLHFGEMGSRWGINRTVGQMYALLFLSEAPLNADQISETLNLSRSNVSMGLKELQAWQLVRLQHLPGDRKDYFSTPEDTLDIALTLIQERRKRELDPTLSLLRDTLLDSDRADKKEYAYNRMQEMCDLMEQVARWSDKLQQMDRNSLENVLKLANVTHKLIGLKANWSLKTNPDRAL